MFRNTCILLVLALSVPLLAQRGGGSSGGRGGGGGFSGSRGGGSSSGMRGGGGFSGGMRSGGGFSGYRGGGTAVRGGFSNSRGGYSGVYRGGYSYRGNYGYRGGYGFVRSYPRYWGGYYGGYYPGFYGGFGYYSSYYDPYYYDPYYYPGYASYYSTPAVYSYAAPSSPVVVVNESRSDYGRANYDGPREYAQPTDRPYQPTIYSIAMRDHRIVQVIAYWIKDGALHYVTREHEMREIPMSEVDRRFSEQINRDKGVDFRLPE